MTFNKNLLLIALTVFVGGFAYGAMPKQDFAAFEQALVEYSEVSVRSIQAAKPNAKLLERYRNAVTAIYNNLNMGDQIMALTAIEDSGFDPKEFGIGVKAASVQLRKKSPQEPHSTPMVATKKPQRKVAAAPVAKPMAMPAKTKPVKAAAPKTKVPFSAPKTPVALKKPVTAPKQAPALKQPAAPKAKVMPPAAKTAPVKTVVRAPVKKEADVLARYIPDAGIRNALKKQGLEQIYVDLITQQKRAQSDDKAIKALIDMNLRDDNLVAVAPAATAAPKAIAVAPREESNMQRYRDWLEYFAALRVKIRQERENLEAELKEMKPVNEALKKALQEFQLTKTNSPEDLKRENELKTAAHNLSVQIYEGEVKIVGLRQALMLTDKRESLLKMKIIEEQIQKN